MQGLLDIVLYVAGAVFGAFQTMFKLIFELSGVVALLAGIVLLIVNPAVGIGFIIMGAIGVADAGRTRRR